VGGNSVSAILYEREANGPFKDIYDFVERVNLSACNRSSIENLAKAGAFDCFGMAREMFVAQVLDITFTEQLVRYGQNFQNDKNSLQASLFGDLEPIETDKPQFPEYTPWSRMQMLEEEKNLVTVYLSAHPLDPYYMELTYGCNCTCSEYEEKAVDGARLSFGGLVTGMQEKTSKAGKPFGIVTIEDFNGKVDLRLFGKNYEELRNKFVKGDAVMIKVSVQQSTYNTNYLDTKFESVEPLESVKGKVANAMRISIASDFNSRDFMNCLETFTDVKAGDRQGDLYIRIYDRETQQMTNNHSPQKTRRDKDTMLKAKEWQERLRINTI